MEIVTFMRDGRKYQYRKVVERIKVNPNKVVSVCFTGHRPKDLSGYIPIEKYQWIIDMMEFEIRNQYDKGVRRFITGGAQGIDQLAFIAVKQFVLKSGVTDVYNTLYIPFEGQESCWLSEGPFSKKDYYKIVDAADEVILVNKHVTAQSSRWEVTCALDDRNKQMLQDSVRLLAWYNGRPKGGTFNCIKDAIALGKEVVYLYS